MKFGKYRSDEKILHDEYFGEQPPTALLLAARLVLLCVMSASLVLIFCDIYRFEGEKLIPAGIAAGASGLLYILTSLFPPAVVYGSVIAAAGGTVWLLRERAVKLAGYFWDYMLTRLDSRLLHTSGLLIHKPFLSSARQQAQEELMNTAFFWAAVVLAVLVSLMFTYAVRTRFRLSIPCVVVTIVTAPAVAAETAGFELSYAAFAACLFGFEAIASSYDLDRGFIFGSLTSAYMSDLRSDREYSRRAARLPFGKRAEQDALRYHRYTGNMITVTLLSAAVFFGAAKLIPEGQGLSYQKVLDMISTAMTTATDAVSDLIGVPIGRPDDRGYFSSGSYGDVSGSISIKPPGESDRPVLEVTLTRGDVPVYLRGDIGVYYLNGSWSSVTTAAERYDETVGDSFSPELEYQAFRRYISAAYEPLSVELTPDDVMPLQMVSVKYLRSTRVVFCPVAPYELDCRGSEYYDCFGDSVLRTRSGFVKTFETLALTPALDGRRFGEGGVRRTSEQLADEARGNVDEAIRNGVISAPSGTAAEYLAGIENYRSYVKSTYFGRADVIERFVAESGLSDETVSGLTPYSKAQYLCDYFRANYRYTLGATEGDTMLGEFLYGTHEGHCALFATAMTLAMREVGCPARYVTGYVIYPGEKPAEDGTFRYRLTEKRLHAWTEVYFEGIGWLPFDPTSEVPGYGRNPLPVTAEPAATTSAESAVTTEPPETAEPDETSETTVIPEDNADATTAPDSTKPGKLPGEERGGGDLWLLLLPAIAITAVIAAVAVILLMFAASVKKAEERTVESFMKLPPNEAVRVMYRFIITLLDKKGLTPGVEQLRDFAERVDGSIELKGVNAFFMDVIKVVEKAEFGRDDDSPVTEDEREAVCRYTAAVYDKLMSDISPIKRFFMKISLFL